MIAATAFAVPVQPGSTGTTDVVFTDHALERLGARAWGVASAPSALLRLSHLIEHAQLTGQRPGWLHSTTRGADAWLVLGDLCFPLVPSSDRTHLVAVTCLARNELCTTADRRSRARDRRERDRARERARRHDARCGRST